MFVISELSKTNRNYVAIPAFSLILQPGQCVAIHCARETSDLLMQILLGDSLPSTGQIQLYDEPWVGKHPRKDAAFLLFHDGLQPRLKVREYLYYWQQLHDGAYSLPEALAWSGLQHRAGTLIKELDAAERKRLQLARCMLQNPALFIMEDPGQNLDQESLAYIKSILVHLAGSGKMVLFTTSSAEQAEALGQEWYRLTADGLLPAANQAPQGVLQGLAQAQAQQPQQPKQPQQAQQELGQSQAHIQGQGHALVQSQGHALVPQSAQPSGFDDAAEAASPQALTAVEDEEPSEDQPEVTVKPFNIGKIPANRDDRMILFHATEINYIESADGATLLYVDGEAYPCVMSLGQLEKRLQSFGFYRCHRSYLVNLQQVREIEAWTKDSYILKLDDSKGSKVPLSKNKFHALKKQLGL